MSRVVDPGWTTMPVAEKMDYLASIEVGSLGECDSGSCEFTIVLAVMRSDTQQSGALDGFDVTYTVAEKRYKQSVDFVVLVCPPERPDCSSDFDLT